MSLTPTKENAALIVAAAQLARSSFRAWSEFLVEFKKYSDRVKEQCVNSPVEQMQINAGKARESAFYASLFEECLPVAEKLIAQQQAKQQHGRS